MQERPKIRRPAIPKQNNIVLSMVEELPRSVRVVTFENKI